MNSPTTTSENAATDGRTNEPASAADRIGIRLFTVAFCVIGAVIRRMSKTLAVNLRSITQRIQVQRVLLKAHRELEVRVEDLASANSLLVKQIAERGHFEASLRKSEERYRELFENAQDPIYVHDVNGNYLSVNRAALELGGYSRAEVIGRNFSEFMAPEYVERIRKNKLERTGLTVYEIEIVAKDGRSVPVEVSTRLIYEERVVVAVQGIARDITERKRSEEALRASEKRFQNAFDHAPTGIALAMPNGRFLQVNKSFCAMVGYTEEELLALHFESLTKHEDLAASRELNRGLLAGEFTTVQVEKRYVHKLGHEVFAMVNLSLVQDAQTKPLYVIAQIQDISERKQAEKELRESEERYRLLFENNPQPMWVYDLETLSFSAINEAATRHYGYSREEFLSMTVKDIRPREDVPRFLENLSNPSGGVDDCGIWRHRKKDGSIIDVEITSHEFLFAGRSAELVLANDITHRRKLEVKLRQAQKLESMGQLAAGIAHEINTPTQYVSDNTRFLQDAFQDLLKVQQKYFQLTEACRAGAATAHLLAEVEASAKEADVDYLTQEIPKALDQALEGTERISKIVQSMKDFAHPGASVMRPCDLNKAIESTITVARGEWKYVAEMVTDFDTTLPLVPCLQGEFNQVVLNMIINAAHAIGDVIGDGSAARGTITISTRHTREWAEIRVSDTGTGISQTNRARIFDPFFTTKEVGKGTGQGLSISHNVVVEKHGGTITVETEEGAGTTFIIRLPLQEIAKTPDGLMKEAA